MSADTEAQAQQGWRWKRESRKVGGVRIPAWTLYIQDDRTASVGQEYSLQGGQFEAGRFRWDIDPLNTLQIALQSREGYVTAAQAKTYCEEYIRCRLKEIAASQEKKRMPARQGYVVMVPTLYMVPHVVAAFGPKDAQESVANHSPVVTVTTKDDDAELERRMLPTEMPWPVFLATDRYTPELVQAILGEDLGRTW